MTSGGQLGVPKTLRGWGVGVPDVPVPMAYGVPWVSLSVGVPLLSPRVAPPVPMPMAFGVPWGSPSYPQGWPSCPQGMRWPWCPLLSPRVAPPVPIPMAFGVPWGSPSYPQGCSLLSPRQGFVPIGVPAVPIPMAFGVPWVSPPVPIPVALAVPWDARPHIQGFSSPRCPPDVPPMSPGSRRALWG